MPAAGVGEGNTLHAVHLGVEVLHVASASMGGSVDWPLGRANGPGDCWTHASSLEPDRPRC
eukprot:2735217-Prorocentrum_lima.AAC.1